MGCSKKPDHHSAKTAPREPQPQRRRRRLPVQEAILVNSCLDNCALWFERTEELRAGKDCGNHQATPFIEQMRTPARATKPVTALLRTEPDLWDAGREPQAPLLTYGVHPGESCPALLQKGGELCFKASSPQLKFKLPFQSVFVTQSAPTFELANCAGTPLRVRVSSHAKHFQHTTGLCPPPPFSAVTAGRPRRKHLGGQEMPPTSQSLRLVRRVKCSDSLSLLSLFH